MRSNLGERDLASTEKLWLGALLALELVVAAASPGGSRSSTASAARRRSGHGWWGVGQMAGGAREAKGGWCASPCNEVWRESGRTDQLAAAAAKKLSL